MVRYRGDEAALERRGFQPCQPGAALLWEDAEAAAVAMRAAQRRGDEALASEWSCLLGHFRAEAAIASVNAFGVPAFAVGAMS